MMLLSSAASSANGRNWSAEEGANVLLLDKGNKLGRKLAISVADAVT